MTDSPSLRGSASKYDYDVFISYTHVDNLPFGTENQHWVTLLDDYLSTRLQQLVNKHATVWRDDKVQGNDVFSESVSERLKKVAVLVSVCSPGYLHSEWCQRELDEFVDAAEIGGGLQVDGMSRVFKVVKTPVPLDELPAPLASVLGYEFYEEVSEGSRFREYLLSPDEKHHWKFYARADDVAQDIAELLADLEGDASPSGTVDGRTVYLAVAASDVAESRDELRRELERRGHRVLPQRTLPLVAEELSAAVNDDLSEADVAVHLLGARYGTRPEGEDRSIPHLQLDLASEIAARRDLIQLIWTAQDLSTAEEAEALLIDRLERADADTWGEVVRAPLETFKAYLLDRLAPAPPPAASVSPQDAKRVYLVYDPEDREQAAALQAQLQDLGHAVLPPLSEGSESEVREVHETSMVLSDAVLIYYGRSTEHWLRMKLLDLLKAPGWGRTEPFQAAAVWVAPPVTTHKKGFRSSEAMVLDATAHQGSSVLEPFLAPLIASGASP